MSVAKKTTARRASKPIANQSGMLIVGAKTKSEGKKDPMDKDWTYLQDKPVSELHELLAKTIAQRSDIEIDAKQVQAVLAFHPHFQRSKINKTRSGYVGLNPVIVEQRSVHMVQAHKDAREILSAPVAKKAAVKKTAARRAVKKAA